MAATPLLPPDGGAMPSAKDLYRQHMRSSLPWATNDTIGAARRQSNSTPREPQRQSSAPPGLLGARTGTATCRSALDMFAEAGAPNVGCGPRSARGSRPTAAPLIHLPDAMTSSASGALAGEWHGQTSPRVGPKGGGAWWRLTPRQSTPRQTTPRRSAQVSTIGDIMEGKAASESPATGSTTAAITLRHLSDPWRHGTDVPRAGSKGRGSQVSRGLWRDLPAYGASPCLRSEACLTSTGLENEFHGQAAPLEAAKQQPTPDAGVLAARPKPEGSLLLSSVPLSPRTTGFSTAVAGQRPPQMARIVQPLLGMPRSSDKLDRARYLKEMSQSEFGQTVFLPVETTSLRGPPRNEMRASSAGRQRYLSEMKHSEDHLHHLYANSDTVDTPKTGGIANELAGMDELLVAAEKRLEEWCSFKSQHREDLEQLAQDLSEAPPGADDSMRVPERRRDYHCPVRTKATTELGARKVRDQVNSSMHPVSARSVGSLWTPRARPGSPIRVGAAAKSGWRPVGGGGAGLGGVVAGREPGRLRSTC